MSCAYLKEVDQQAMTPFVSCGVEASNDMVWVFVRVGAWWETSISLVYFVQLCGSGQNVMNHRGEVNAESYVVPQYLAVSCPVHTLEYYIRSSMTFWDI
jgi:hypothetical protein